MKLVGIGGTDGSGKDSLGNMLAEKHGWHFLTVTDLLRDEARKRELSLTRETYRNISAEWRREHGMAVLVDMALNQYQSQIRDTKLGGLAIASLRHPAEADRVHELGGKVVWVDADPKIRYQRISARNRGTEDHVTYEQFLAEEKTQMQHSGDKATLSLAAVKEKADIFIQNNGNDIEVFKNEAEKSLAGLLRNT